MQDVDQQGLRNSILNMLSDFETAKVSNAEDRSAMSEGDEFVDLSDLPKGVQKAGPGKISDPGELLPKNAVSAATWKKICDELSG